MYRYLYSYIFIYRRGRVLQNYIACVNQENLDKKTSKYTVWVVHKCFLSIKLGLFRHLYYQGYNQYADQTTDRLPDVTGKQVSTSSDQSRSTKQCNECVCVSPFSENRTGNVPTNSCTHTYTHIYTYTQTKYMASNVESRQLNKWHFSMFLF